MFRQPFKGQLMKLCMRLQLGYPCFSLLLCLCPALCTLHPALRPQHCRVTADVLLPNAGAAAADATLLGMTPTTVC